MNDREIMERVFDALVWTFADSPLTVSKMGDKVFISHGDQEWCLNLWSAQQSMKGWFEMCPFCNAIVAVHCVSEKEARRCMEWTKQLGKTDADT